MHGSPYAGFIASMLVRARRLAFGTRVAACARPAVRALRRHYLSFVSMGVLGIAGAVAMTSQSYEAHDRGAESIATGSFAANPPPSPVPTTRATLATATRRAITFYLLESEQQRTLVINAVTTDARDRQSGPNVTDLVVYLLAGTPEQEARTIDRLNFEWSVASQNRIDMRVIDLRP